MELEQTTLAQERRRRRRIAAGNVQQMVRLRRLLHPRHGGVAFAFASGKALRAVMPLALIAAFGGSAVLAPSSPFFAAAAGVQALLYAVALLPAALPERTWPKPIGALAYLVRGHACAFVGAALYLLTPRGAAGREPVVRRNPGAALPTRRPSSKARPRLWRRRARPSDGPQVQAADRRRRCTVPARSRRRRCSC